MRHYHATTPDELDLIGVHDAWFDPDDVSYNQAQRVVIVPFAQEALQWQDEPPAEDVPQREFIRETQWYTEYRVPMLAAFLTIRNAVAMDTDGRWGDMGILLSLGFDHREKRVLVESNGFMRVSVTSLDAEAQMTREVARYLRRRVDKLLGGEWDKEWQ